MKEELPNTCLDQANTISAEVFVADVAVHVRVKLLEGGALITARWVGVTDTVTPIAMRERHS